MSSNPAAATAAADSPMDGSSTGAGAAAAAAAAPAAAASTSAAAAAPVVPLVHVYTQNLKSLLPDGRHPCAGALPTAQRLAAPNLHTAFVATGDKLSLLQALAPVHPELRIGRQGAYASDFIPLSSRLATLDAHNAQSELQCVAARSCGAEGSGDYLVASVDSYGSAVVSRVHVPLRGADDTEVAASAAAASASGDAPFRVLSSSALRPLSRVEDGWHGVSLHPLHDDQACVASHYGKSLSLYSGEQLLQTLYTAGSPTSFQWMQCEQFAAPLLVCNEGNTLSVWDVRMSNGVGHTDNISRGAVQRLQDTTGTLYALDSHISGLLATGGVDKQVTVYDCRKWGVAGRWKNVLKYELMSLQFSAHSSSSIYVAGLDHEVYCGHWSNLALNQRNLERMAFRGDSRWVGLARTTDPLAQRGGDHLVGITESAQLYVLRNAHLQNGPLPEQDDKQRAQQQQGSNAEAARRRREEVAAQRKERLAAGLSALTPEEVAKREKANERKAQGKKRKAEESATGDASAK